MEYQTSKLNERIEGVGITTLVMAYTITAMVVKFTNVLFGVILFVLFVWLSFPTVRGYTKLHLDTTRYPLAFGASFVGFLIVASPFWEGGVDLRDPIGVILFYVLIPLSVFYLCRLKQKVKKRVYAAFVFLFALFFVLALGKIASQGIDLGYGRFYFHNKNTAGMFFEVVYCYVLFEEKDRPWYQSLLIIAAGGITLISIASKTSIAFCSVFTLGLLSRRLFWWGMIVLGIAGSYVTFTLVDIQGLATAYQRLLLWNDAFQKLTTSWSSILFGYGPGTYSSGVRQLGLYGKEAIHNYYIQYAYSYGVPALGALGLYLFQIFRRFGVIRNGATAGFWVFNAHAVFDVGWVAGAGLLASLMLGLLLSITLQRSAVTDATSVA
jgi:hypothetical protein